jgi:Ca-activated chloride channel homolog
VRRVIGIALLAATGLPAFGAMVLLHGRVVTEDGLPVNKAAIEKVCTDHLEAMPIASTNASGEYLIHIEIGDVDIAFRPSCVLRAALKGYVSSSIEFADWRLFQDPNLPQITMTKRSTNPTLDVFADERIPARAGRVWLNAGKAANANRWAEAERYLRLTVEASPKFAQGWHALAAVLSNEQKVEEARTAERRATELNPKLLEGYLLLARFDLELKDWEDARKSSGELIRIDAKHKYVEPYLQQAIARFQLNDAEGAESAVQDAIRLDPKHDFPRAEYVLGMIRQARHDINGAREHMNLYLTLEPKAFDATEVRARIAHLDDPAPERDLRAEMEHVAAALELSPSSDAWVPGGIEALAKAAGVPGAVSSANFFAEFSRTLVKEMSPGLATGIPHYQARLLAYLQTTAELSRMGERGEDATTITMATRTAAERTATARVLSLIGWRLKPGDVVEPGDEPSDGLRQWIPALIGVDEIEMQRALQAGKTFVLRIPWSNARLIGGEAWSRMVKDLPTYAGGIAEALVRDPRLAKAYSGLGAMGSETAAAVVSTVGLQALVERHADLVARYSDAFALSRDGAAAPGNAEAWAKIAGASPRKAPAFFHALMDRDDGSLAAFYTALERTDAAHQRFFTATPERAERFYAWYRDSNEARWSLLVSTDRWRAELLRELPLDEAGNIRFPGGRRAWTNASGPDDEVVLKAPALEALVSVARIEERRKAPLDEASAKFLAANYAAWRTLFPYFENLPGLGKSEFQALQSFTQAVEQFPHDRKRDALGEWDSLVELIARGAKSGSLDAQQSARAFREACEGVIAPDHAARSMAILNEIGGTGVLHFTAEQRAKFERVRALQRIPAADSATAQDTLAALSGVVYAASLDPDALLVKEDPGLLARHQFAGNAGELFPPAKLVRSSSAPGSYLSGTFVNLDEVARTLVRAGDPARRVEAGGEAQSGPAGNEAEAVAADFRAEGRLVEVYATVTDSRGRYMDDLTGEQFSVIDGGEPRPIAGFESRSAELSVALLLDTTASMADALPAVKAAALRLISELRAEDQIAVYSFNERVSQLAPFTADKDAAKRAVLHIEPFGETALYDALARVNRDLAARTGKKVIVMLTDGDDNASTLTSGAAIEQAKAAGVPVYTIAEGAALTNPEYLKQLAGVSQSTGGESFAIHNRGEIHGVFEKISEDLLHTYFFAFRPEGAEKHEYRPIEVRVSGGRNLKVRAREGYYPE